MGHKWFDCKVQRRAEFANQFLGSVSGHRPHTDPRASDALEGALREAVRSGRLAPGTVLPSSRGLAHDLGLGRGTVVEVYA